MLFLNKYMLSRKAVIEFQVVYKKQFNRDISYEEAEKMGTKLLKLMKIIYRPIPKKKAK